MKVSKFSDSQIASILKQAESGVPVPHCVVSMASAVPPSTNGAANTQAWTQTS